MFWFGRLSVPPPCPVDDAPHTTCTTSGPIVVLQTPARDALVAADALRAAPPTLPPLRAEAIQQTLAPTQFTTGTYRGRRKGRR